MKWNRKIKNKGNLVNAVQMFDSLADMIKQVKGCSFHLDTHQIKPGEFFKWQGSQEAFTVSHDAIDSVAKYIRNQAVHHRQKSMIPDWELTRKSLGD